MQRIMLRHAAFITGFTLFTLTFSSFKIATPFKGYPSNDHDSTKGFKSLLSSISRDLANAEQFELNSKATSFVSSYLNKESDDLAKLKEWAKPYFLIYDQILSDNGLPIELKYLSVIESNLQFDLVSGKGAVGPWQLMPDEAKRFHLKVTRKYDERTNLNKSTQVAAKLLRELYDKFGDWLLVIAAYNAGAGGVKRAIAKAGSDNFWVLQSYLPEETRNHVKRYIATHYFFEGSGGWTTLTARESIEKKARLAYIQNKLDSLTKLADADVETVEIVGKYNSIAVSNYLLMDLEQFNRLNPLFDKTLAEGKFYTLRLPSDKLEIFKAKKQIILQESVQLLLSGSVSSTGTN
ncbi:MAG TPA: lytic transglycosylase domain-containing protein [Chitinophagaceae bacterium]|jgi:membrane-bound lytic murein transglycosylase D